MTERSLSPEDIGRLPCCAAIVAAKGAASPYAADAVVRAYQGRHVAELCRDIGWPCDDASVVTIVAGIGTLRMAWTGNILTAVPVATASESHPMSGAAAPLPLPADPLVRAQRERLCAECSHHAGDRCSVAGCACAGLGRPAARFSRCPVGRW